MATTLDEIADRLWPTYIHGAWSGSAAAGMETLTLADLTLLDAKLRAVLAQPAGASGDLAHVTHKVLFQAEDDMPITGGLFETVRRYLAAQPPAVVNQVVAGTKNGLRALGPQPLLFKAALQRPRAYQASVLLGLPYSYEDAKSANTPSIMSGHCLQGLFVATSAYIDQQQQIDGLLGARRALQQFGVDFDDRRVFARVHYPSDNLASWFICLRLSPTCFGSGAATARTFMSEAIRASQVYAAMKAVVTADPQSIYGPLLTWLDGML
jgi:hypothetical protein